MKQTNHNVQNSKKMKEQPVKRAGSSSDKTADDVNKLKKLKRTDLLEIILLLKEKEKSLEEENQDLREQLEALKKKVNLRKNALKKDDALGSEATNLENLFYDFINKAAMYYALLEELGENAAEDRAREGHITDEKK